MTEEQIGRCIKIAMVIAGMDPPQLAAKLSVAPQTVYSYLKGRCTNIIQISKVAAACDMTLEELLKLADKPGVASDKAE